MSVMGGHVAVVKLLCCKGADLTIKNNVSIYRLTRLIISDKSSTLTSCVVVLLFDNIFYICVVYIIRKVMMRCIRLSEI